MKEAPITTGAITKPTNFNEDYEFMFRDSSKNSLDSGLQVTSVYSSREDLSTRNILVPTFAEKPRKSKYMLFN